MANFAKAQLLKYGWKEGKGLGKDENGIVEALKPKLKFDTSGVGHKNLEFSWWDCVYDKALQNIVLDKKADEVSISIVKENAFNISSSKSGLNNSKKNHSLHYGKFLKTSTLQDGNLIRDSTCEVIEDDSEDNPTIVKMSDEELFKACGGRTAHKGARHGLKLNGKLARIAEQEKQLQANSFFKTNEQSFQSNGIKHKKNKKKKKNMEIDNCIVLRNEHVSDNDVDCLVSTQPIESEEIDRKPSKRTCRKVKRKINDLTHQLTKSCMIQDNSISEDEGISSETKDSREMVEEKQKKNKTKKKKSKRNRDEEVLNSNIKELHLDDDVPMGPSIKKSRKSDNSLPEIFFTSEKDDEVLNIVQGTYSSNSVKSRSEYKKEKIHRSSKDFKFCSEAQRLNAKIQLKKSKKIARKERKKLQELSESLLAVSLNVDSGDSVANVTKKSKSFKKLHKKHKPK